MAGIDSTINVLQAGIKAEYLRQQTIAGNIANMQTPGYRSLDIKFEDMLAKAIKSGSNPQDIEPELYSPNTTPIKHNGNDVSFESEVGRMVENSLKHKTYVKLLNKKFQQVEQAIQTP
ncbi:MAG: flagellar basal body rod protein FlgB [Phycisphaerae bacterium]